MMHDHRLGEWLAPLTMAVLLSLRANIPYFTSKRVEHSRYLPISL